MEASGPDAAGVVLFDGVCALCDASVRFLLARDRRGRFRYAPLQGETARAVLKRHPETGDDVSTVLYVRAMGTERETVDARSDAALLILRELGGFWKMVSWLRVVPRAIRDGVYDWIARHRYGWFGKFDACRLPDDESAERFLP